MADVARSLEEPSLEVRSLRTAKDTAAHLGPLTGRTLLVTGASSGIGKECAKALVSAGATVFVVCRAGARADDALQELTQAAGAKGSAHLLPCDLGKPEHIRRCAAEFLKDRSRPLHGLVCNAGILAVPKWGELTPGMESQLAVNFLSHFLLCRLLHDRLAATEGSRVVWVASESHRRVLETGFDLPAELPPPEAGYDPLHAYAFSNLCRILGARELARRVPYPVLILHPSVSIGTGIVRHMPLTLFMRQFFVAVVWEMRPNNPFQGASNGARGVTWCAIAPVESVAPLRGAYLNGNCSGAWAPEWRGLARSSALAERDDLAKQVYEFAERWAEGKLDDASGKGRRPSPSSANGSGWWQGPRPTAMALAVLVVFVSIFWQALISPKPGR